MKLIGCVQHWGDKNDELDSGPGDRVVELTVNKDVEGGEVRLSISDPGVDDVVSLDVLLPLPQLVASSAAAAMEA